MKIQLFCLAAWSVLAVPSSLRAAELPPLPDGAVTYVVMPDTQVYSGEGKRVKKGPPPMGPVRNDGIENMVDWIVSNREAERIFFVSHTGDIVDVNTNLQWAFASSAMTRLDGKVPYGICPGNHDQGGRRGASTELFVKYFPASRFEGYAWYGGHFEGYVNGAGDRVSYDNANSYQLVEAAGEKFIFLHIECNAPEPVLAWADGVLDRHADRHAVVATHQDLGFLKRAFQDAYNRRPKSEENRAPDLATLGRLCWTKRHGSEGVSAQKAWEGHWSKHANLFLIVSGDQGPVNTWHREDRGVHGNVVQAFMQDYQSTALRLFRINPAEKKMDVITLDVAGKKLLEDYRGWHGAKWHQFSVPLDFR